MSGAIGEQVGAIVIGNSGINGEAFAERARKRGLLTVEHDGFIAIHKDKNEKYTVKAGELQRVD